MAGLPPVGMALERVFQWLFEVDTSVFFHGIRGAVIGGWVLAVVALGLVHWGLRSQWRRSDRLDQTLARGFAVGLALGISLGSLLLGVVLIPMTVFTLLVGIGLFGMVPFCVSAILFVRVRELADPLPTGRFPIQSYLLAQALGVAVAWGLPAVLGVHFTG